jgi:hypothetical protein
MDICHPRRFIAIDNFKVHEQAELWGKPTSHWFGGKTHGGFYRDHFAAEIGAGIVAVIEAESDAGIGELENASVDVFYIDGDHSYESVRRDLAAAVLKVRPDGYIILNDYILVDHLGATVPYGVIYAAHEFMIQQNWGMQYFALQTTMFCDVVLRRKDHLRRPDIVMREMMALQRFDERTKMAAARQDVTSIEQENIALRWEIQALRASSSWRMTAPLRAAKRIVQRSR